MVGTALKGVSSHHHASLLREIRNKDYEVLQKAVDTQQREKIRNGTWHDGRLDCVAGNGIMSELGIGDESLAGMGGVVPSDWTQVNEETSRKQKIELDVVTATSLPIVVIRNFSGRVGSSQETLLAVLAEWAAMLAENQAGGRSLRHFS